jgi:nucleoside-triphosphatase THEP1
MKNTVETLKAQAQKVNKFLKKEVFEIGQRNGFNYFDFKDHSKSALFNSARSNRELSEQIEAFYEGLIYEI